MGGAGSFVRSGIGRWLARTATRLLFSRERADLRWWRRRAQRHGAHSVRNRGHSPTEGARLDAWQKGILFPILRRRLRGDEQLVLDFGCGPGRFTPDLAELIGGRAIGVDPIEALLEHAPRHAKVDYRLLRGGAIDLDDRSVDVVWVCLVLMCITDRRALERTAAEIWRVLRDDGLLFLVENTQPRDDTRHLRYRLIDEYRSLFPGIRLEHEGDYLDLGERISILAGRKRGVDTDG